MATTAVDQKKVDEKHIKEIREFQKASSANRRCFDCNEMGPQYICLDFNTFICTACSGIHREFSHRIKSISMSTFTDTEVKNIVKFGGNEAAHKFWLARFDVNSQPSSNLNSRDRVRNFIRDVYIDRRWVFEEPKPKPEPVKKEVKKQPAAQPAAPVDFNPFQIAPPPSSSASVAFGDFSSFDKQQQQPAATVDFADFASFDQPAAQAGFVADFDSFNSSTSEPAVNFFQSPKAAAGSGQQYVSFQPFGDPVAATKTVDSFFGAFDAPATPQPSVAVHDPFAAFPSSPAPASSQSAATKKAVVASDPFADFDAVTPTNVADPFSQPFAAPSSPFGSSKAPTHDPFASFDAPAQQPAAAAASADPFNAFDTLVAPEPTLQPSFNTTPAPVVDLWGQPPPQSKAQPGQQAFGSTHSTQYAPQASQYNPPATQYTPQATQYPQTQQSFPTKPTPFDVVPTYSSNQGTNPAFPSNPAAYSSNAFVKKETAPQKALVDPFASLDIGIKSTASSTASINSTPFHATAHQFQSNGYPVSQPHYTSNNQPHSYHPNIVVAPVTQKPTSSNPFDMF